MSTDIKNGNRLPTVYTERQKKMMMETYGRILTPEEFAERKRRFCSTEEDITYTEDGIMKL
jgi:hypothetical protein